MPKTGHPSGNYVGLHVGEDSYCSHSPDDHGMNIQVLLLQRNTAL
jgi:hypothetical protein